MSQPAPPEHAAPENDALPTVSIVCCVEAGPLEPMAVRLAESLRRFGGRLANSPFFAVKSRFGPDMRRETREAFDRLGVTYLSRWISPRYGWQKFMNKPLALAWVESLANTEQLVWLDSDILCVGEPSELPLEPGMQFAANPAAKDIATSGPDDPNEPYWRELCRLFGLSLDELPWVVTCDQNERIRLQWNSGVFSFRRGDGLAERYLENCFKVLDAGLSHHGAGVHFTDQVVLGLTMLQLGLTYRQLPFSHNRTMGDFVKNYDMAGLKAARLLHYHNAMTPAYWPTMLDLLRETQPDACAWLQQLSPVTQDLPPAQHLLRQTLYVTRTLRRRMFVRRCRSL